MISDPGQCAAIPQNNCPAQGSCDTCRATAVNSSLSTLCTWCDRTGTSSCIFGQNCGAGGTAVTNCSLSNPCLPHKACDACQGAADGCHWCESGTNRFCQRNTTNCGQGTNEIVDCVDASTCYQSTDCASCEAASCNWCASFTGGAATCNENCFGAPLTCPTSPTPVASTTATPPNVQTPSTGTTTGTPPANAPTPQSVAPTGGSPAVNPPTDQPTAVVNSPTSVQTSSQTTAPTVTPSQMLGPSGTISPTQKAATPNPPADNRTLASTAVFSAVLGAFALACALKF